MSVPPEMRRVIESDLARLESEEKIRILFAVESGSRAWGFPSPNSDYDVRLVYIRRKPWYLSIDLETRRDVVERPCVELIDLSGWDIRKALVLFLRSNPPLLEWLASPFVYVDRLGFADRLRELVPAYFSPTAAMHHYLQMARGHVRSYLQGDRVRTKKYFYVLRPLLAACWIEQGRGAVPMAFSQLVETLVDHPALKAAIDELVTRKMAGEELQDGPRVSVIHEFVTSELQRLESVAGSLPKVRGETEPLNALFREYLERAWEGSSDSECGSGPGLPA